MAIAAATASLACLDASSMAAAEGAGFEDCCAFPTDARGPLLVTEAGGTNDFWFTVNGTAGATLFDFGPEVEGLAAAAAAKDCGASVGCDVTCEVEARASDMGGLESMGGVGALCEGAGVEALLVVFEIALSLTGSSEVGLGGCI